jgi:hypothetical protein
VRLSASSELVLITSTGSGMLLGVVETGRELREEKLVEGTHVPCGAGVAAGQRVMAARENGRAAGRLQL